MQKAAFVNQPVDHQENGKKQYSVPQTKLITAVGLLPFFLVAVDVQCIYRGICVAKDAV